MTRWLIDTDIGDDIDDAFAIRYALACGMEIAAVTTAMRASVQRAKLVKYFLHANKTEAPVYAGADDPLAQPYAKFFCPASWSRGEILENGKDWVPQMPEEAEVFSADSGDAADAIVSLAKEGELSVFALGPLTNLALAIETDAAACSRIREIVMLGGNFSQHRAEWNIRLDPEAAAIVFGSGIPVRLIPTDLTWEPCLADGEIMRRLGRLSGGGGEALKDFLARWSKIPIYEGKMPCMHDVLPVAAVADASIVTFEKMRVLVPLQGEERAITVQDPRGDEMFVGVRVDAKKFWQSFCDAMDI